MEKGKVVIWGNLNEIDQLMVDRLSWPSCIQVFYFKDLAEAIASEDEDFLDRTLLTVISVGHDIKSQEVDKLLNRSGTYREDVRFLEISNPTFDAVTHFRISDFLLFTRSPQL